MRELRHQKRRDLYVNPLTQAGEYKRIIKEKNFTQSQLAKFLGVSRMRVTQMLNLLKFPVKQQNYILKHGKEKFITERPLRKLAALAKQRSKNRKGR